MEDGGAGTTIANHGFTHTMDKLEVDEPRSRGKESADAQRRRTCTCAHKTRVRVAENVGLAIVIVIVWSLLLLPVIFYHLPNVRMQRLLACSVDVS